jgi:hypothetical protein
MSTEINQKIENRAVRKLVLYVIGIIFVSSILFAINTGLVFSLAQGIAGLLPDLPGASQLIQLVIFIGPVFLLYLEWYVWDVLTARRVR